MQSYFLGFNSVVTIMAVLSMTECAFDPKVGAPFCILYKVAALYTYSFVRCWCCLLGDFRNGTIHPQCTLNNSPERDDNKEGKVLPKSKGKSGVDDSSHFSANGPCWDSTSASSSFFVNSCGCCSSGSKSARRCLIIDVAESGKLLKLFIWNCETPTEDFFSPFSSVNSKERLIDMTWNKQRTHWDKSKCCRKIHFLANWAKVVNTVQSLRRSHLLPSRPSTIQKWETKTKGKWNCTEAHVDYLLF